jgi:hypothetical protein
LNRYRQSGRCLIHILRGKFDPAVGFERARECKIGEIQTAVYLFESHAILQAVDYMGKTNGLRRKYQ